MSLRARESKQPAARGVICPDLSARARQPGKCGNRARKYVKCMVKWYLRARGSCCLSYDVIQWMSEYSRPFRAHERDLRSNLTVVWRICISCARIVVAHRCITMVYFPPLTARDRGVRHLQPPSGCCSRLTVTRSESTACRGSRRNGSARDNGSVAYCARF